MTTRSAEEVVGGAQAVEVDVEEGDVGPEPHRALRRADPDRPRADDDDVAARDAGHARQARCRGRRGLCRGSRRLPGPRGARRPRSSASSRGRLPVGALHRLVGDGDRRPPARARAASSGAAARWRYVKSACPARSRPYSSAMGSLTLRTARRSAHTRSTPSSCGAGRRVLLVARSRFRAPAPRSTTTRWPASVSARAPAGRQGDALLSRA